MDNSIITYGIVGQFEGLEVWFEPITDEIDAFVIRKQNGHIVQVYVPCNPNPSVYDKTEVL